MIYLELMILLNDISLLFSLQLLYFEQEANGGYGLALQVIHSIFLLCLNRVYVNLCDREVRRYIKIV